MPNNLEIPKFSIKLPELPKGEEIFTKTIEIARRSIFETYPQEKYPILYERQTRVAPLERVQLLSSQEIIGREEQIKDPGCILTYNVLVESGQIEPDVRKKLYHISQGVSYFVDTSSQDPQIFFSKERFKDLSSDNPIERSESAIDLGLSYIYASFTALIEPQEVLNNIHPLVKSLAKDYLLDYLLPEIKRDLPGSDIKNIEKVVFTALDKTEGSLKPRFLASGGRFLILLSGQEPKTAEFCTGNEFDTQVRAFLCVPIMRRFIDLMSLNLMTSKMKYKVPVSAQKKDESARDKLKVVGIKERGEVLSAYLNSDLLFAFLASHNQRLIIE
jgi:hypothetical protein